MFAARPWLARPPEPPPRRAPTPPPAAGGFGPPAHALAATAMATHRCQMGHEISPGSSYCAQGHPIALDQMQFANDGYGPPPGFGAQPPQPAYGTPAPAPYGAPQPQAYAPPPPQPVYAPPPQPAPVYAPPPAYAPPPQQGYAPQGGYVPSPQGGYAPAPQYAPPPAYAPPPEPPRDATPSNVLRGFLIAYGMNPSGDFWPLTGGRHIVGRLGPGDGVNITLQDPTISSRHGALVVDAMSGTITMEDTGSTNGTFVNDEHIGFNGRRELRDGDRLRLGGFTTVIKVIGRI